MTVSPPPKTEQMKRFYFYPKKKTDLVSPVSLCDISYSTEKQRIRKKKVYCCD